MEEQVLRDVVERILQSIEWPVDFIVLYGSWARSEASGLSDIDVGVRLQVRGDQLHLAELEVAGLYDPEGMPPVQVTLLNGAPLTLQFRVVRDGRLLYQRVEGIWFMFVEQVLTRYPDWRLYLDHYLSESLEAM